MSLIITLFNSFKFTATLFIFLCYIYCLLSIYGVYVQSKIYWNRAADWQWGGPQYGRRNCWVNLLVLNFIFYELSFRHVKDIIILTAGCQLLSSVISNYFWWFWLLAPARGGWIIWKNILSPYFFQQAPNEPEIEDKKQKKMERRMKRMQR